MSLLNILILGLTFLSYIFCAGIIYPFKPIKTRKTAVIGFGITILAIVICEAILEYVAKHEQQAIGAIQTENTGLVAQGYGNVEAALNTTSIIFFVLLIICVAGIVYPFKPFKSRKMAMFGFVVTFIVYIFSLSSITNSPEYIAVAEQEAADSIQAAKVALDSQDYDKAEAKLVGISEFVSAGKRVEVAQIKGAIARGRELPIMQNIITSDEYDALTKLKKVKELWDGLKGNEAGLKGISPKLELIVLDFVKPIPSTELLQNRLGYELLVEIDAYTILPDPSYAEKAKSYAAKSAGKDGETRVCIIPNYDFSLQVPRHLNDPRSFKPVRVYWGAFNNNGKRRTVYMDYRAKNGFGGVISNTATGVVNLSTCRLTLLSLD